MSSRRCHIVYFDGGLKSEDGFLLPDGSIVSSPPEEDIVFGKAQPSTIQSCGLPGINHFRKLSFHEKQKECNDHQSKCVSTTRKKNKKRKDTMGGEKGVIAPVFGKAQPSTIQSCGLPGINHFRKLSFREKQKECNDHQSKCVSTTRKKNKKRKDTMGGEKGVIAPGDDPNLNDVQDLGASSDDGGDDGGDNINVDGGTNVGEEPPPEPIHFTGESQFQLGTQDEDHGSRQGECRNWATRGKRSRQRRAFPDTETGSSHNHPLGYDSSSVSVEQQGGWSYGEPSEDGAWTLYPTRAYGEPSVHEDWTLNPAPPRYYPQSGDTSSYGYSYGDTEHTDYSNVGSNSLLSFANPGKYSQSGSSDMPRAGSSRSMRAPSRGRRSNVQEQCENDRQWFPTDASSWLGAMMTENESVPVSSISHIEQVHGRPLLGYLLDNCSDQETYNIYVSQYEHNYSTTMEWSYYCSHWLPRLAQSTQSVQPDPDFVPARASFWW